MSGSYFPGHGFTEMRYRLAYRVYHRPFCRPLHTHHGVWRARSGILVRLEDEGGAVRYGEIAPLPWFGTESLEAAIALCHALSPHCTAADLASIPETHPACQFGLQAALEQFSISVPSDAVPELPGMSLLLPTGEAALNALPSALPDAAHPPTFKWKIGVTDWETEFAWAEQLRQRLPAGALLRLDANGGLSARVARRWLAWGDRTGQVEFLEQPLPVADFEEMRRLSQQFRTPLALDESVPTLSQLQTCLDQGWTGVVVIKGAIAGSPQQLRALAQQRPLDIVWSSVFETAIARRYLLGQLIPSIPVQRQRALGFGVDQWFNDQWSGCSDAFLWQSLSPPVRSSPNG